MLSKFITIFKIPELRQKILLTLGLLAVYRMGFAIPLPFIDQERMAEALKSASDGQFGSILAAIQLFSASNFGSIFGLGIMPYITASIIFQLLGTVYPPLEALQKEGESGRRKINEYTRYATVLICLFQSWFFISNIGNFFGDPAIVLTDYQGFYWQLVATITMTSGTVLLMWVGEQIDAYGIGNGISLLIMAGILARMPSALVGLIRPALQDGIGIGQEAGIEKLLVLTALFIGVVVWVIAITQGQRRIPIQSAKHVRGRRVMGGQRQHLPLRVNQAGVMPIIFASSLLIFPNFVFKQLDQIWPDVAVFSGLANAFSPGSGFIYNLCYVILIYFFCYFWTAITFNPKDMADNLKDYGSFIPGYRPGGRTAQYLEQIMVRITYVGAAFLALVAIIPTLISVALGVDPAIAMFFGGTGLLIVVSVGLDLVQKIDSHLVMRNYSGMLESDS